MLRNDKFIQKVKVNTAWLRDLTKPHIPQHTKNNIIFVFKIAPKELITSISPCIIEVLKSCEYLT